MEGEKKTCGERSPVQGLSWHCDCEMEVVVEKREREGGELVARCGRAKNADATMRACALALWPRHATPRHGAARRDAVGGARQLDTTHGGIALLICRWLLLILMLLLATSSVLKCSNLK